MWIAVLRVLRHPITAQIFLAVIAVLGDVLAKNKGKGGTVT